MAGRLLLMPGGLSRESLPCFCCVCPDGGLGLECRCPGDFGCGSYGGVVFRVFLVFLGFFQLLKEDGGGPKLLNGDGFELVEFVVG